MAINPSNEKLLCHYCSKGFTLRGPSAPLVAPLGSSLVLPCYTDKPLPVKGLEVEWRRTDSETLVHLYQDGESRPEAQQQDYQDRAHFFTDQIQHGNFSLRLDNLTAEDEGEYTCKVYSQQDSGETVVHIKDVERLRVSGSSRSISAYAGDDVTLNCSVDSHIKPEHIEEVSWRKTDEDEDIPVLLYQNNEAFPGSSDAQYRDRVEFFTDEISKGNFSLRLKSVRIEDKGVYMCHVFAGVLSANTTVVLERLGFSALHIMVLVLSIAASGSALLLCCLIFCISHTGFTVTYSQDTVVRLGDSMILCCYSVEPLPVKDLKVEWRRTDKKNALVHLYQDGKSRPEAQLQDYQDRAHFFTDQIQHGNFSLRLDNLRAEDAGEYTCKVYSKQKSVLSTQFTVEKGSYFLSVKVSSTSPVVPLGSSVILRCYVDEPLTVEDLKVEWRRTDTNALVHLYQSRAEAQQQDYQDRAHFFTDQIQHGNFSLRLDNLRAEDEGEYTWYTKEQRNSDREQRGLSLSEPRASVETSGVHSYSPGGLFLVAMAKRGDVSANDD
ncbi:butyrophilin-like protein 2 [Pimephales promelas]|uniref:butyrophilin-like protein 2 n=1 Tax=Pimephales promelas TaxID=90988 RepID=UPI001955CBEF|nr:butyrophilin-like protein 2 [Pimephales promelas]